ncbi:host-nuclease inhibitor Gam family protein [Maridesulfovibrio sp.]|uniref:host-nuclease inhibitor Gam family protein n=1 Tax=Maridesulfovibrio sp. TaxID=2795000 RepID=UPI002A18DA40|nr:host-nuclease inhibitor Gam family protein [Maridesulfovibrio sp.]
MTTNRKKPEIMVIEDLPAVDKAMSEIAELERGIGKLEADMNETIDAAKAVCKLKVEPKKARIKVLEAALGTYASLNKDELFPKNKSKKMTFGIIGFRKSTKLLTIGKTTMAEVLELLKAHKLTKGIKLTESVDKEAMKGWTDEKLKTVRMRRKEEDAFFYEIAQEDSGD